MAPLRVTACGGGNAVHVFASIIAEDVEMSLFLNYQDEAAEFRDGMEAAGGMVTCHYRDQAFTGTPSFVSKDAAEVIPGRDVVLLPVPSFAHRSILEAIAPHLSDNTIVCAVPGGGGFDLLAHEIMSQHCNARNIIICGTNQLPYQCRTTTYGSSVELIGFKGNIDVATTPADAAERVAKVLTRVIGLTTVSPLKHFIEVTLAPANQVIHPCIMYGLFRDFNGEPYEDRPMFYQGTTDFTAGIMDTVSVEIQSIAEALHLKLGLTFSKKIPNIADLMRGLYGNELDDPSCTRTIFCSNKGYAGLRAPMEPHSSGQGWVPRFQYRYLTEDIPHGLCVVKGLAVLAGIETPMIDTLIIWAQGHLQKQYLTIDGQIGPDFTDTGAPQARGIDTLGKLGEAM